MFSKRIVLLLTLIMAFMPMAVSYAHYTEVASQIAAINAVVAMEHANHDTQTADHCQPHSSHPDKLQSSGCSFHVCVDCAVTSIFQFIPIHSPTFYSLSEKLEPLSLISPPAIRPPIAFI